MVTEEPLKIDEVAVMENDSTLMGIYEEPLKRFGFKVQTIGSADEAIHLAEGKNLYNYILDLHMGEDREQEGLDALERLKSIDENIQVAILSGYPEVYRRRAKRLRADIFRTKS